MKGVRAFPCSRYTTPVQNALEYTLLDRIESRTRSDRDRPLRVHEERSWI